MKHGSSRRAAKALGVHPSGLDDLVLRVKKRAAKHGWSPEHNFTHPTPPGYFVKNTTIQYGPNGDVVNTWDRVHLEDQERYDAIIHAIEGICEGIKPLRPINPPRKTNKDLLNLYTLTDYHIGMASHAAETGDDWDLEIAERIVLQAFDDMVEGSCSADICILNQLGDFAHFDSMLPLTPTSGHVLDASARYDAIAELCLRLMVQITERLLRAHKKVVVIAAEGNHDPIGSIWLRKALKFLYLNNPRVEVNDSAIPFYAYQHGEIMLAFHHGHKLKPVDLQQFFSAEPRRS